MAQYNLENFRQAIKHVARSQYFQIKFPGEGRKVTATDSVLTALARSTSLPAVTHGTLEVPFRGLMMKIADRSEFPEWTVTYLCTEDHGLRQDHIKWMHQAYIPSDQANLAHGNYKVNGIEVQHLDSTTHNPIYTYKFFGMFPTSVGEMGVTQEGGEFLTFDVTYAFDTFEAYQGENTNINANIGQTGEADNTEGVNIVDKILNLF